MYVLYEWNMKLFAFRYFRNFEDFGNRDYSNQVPMFFRYPFQKILIKLVVQKQLSKRLS